VDIQRAAGKPLFAVIRFGSPRQPVESVGGRQGGVCPGWTRPRQEHYGELVGVRIARWARCARSCATTWACLTTQLLGLRQRQRRLPGASTRRPWGACAATKAACLKAAFACPASSNGPRSVRPRITDKLSAPRMWTSSPTVADILGLPDDVMIKPIDGISLKPLFAGARNRRAHQAARLPLRQQARAHRPALQNPHREH